MDFDHLYVRLTKGNIDFATTKELQSFKESPREVVFSGKAYVIADMIGSRWWRRSGSVPYQITYVVKIVLDNANPNWVRLDYYEDEDLERWIWGKDIPLVEGEFVMVF